MMKVKKAKKSTPKAIKNVMLMIMQQDLICIKL